ncbi:MAG: hypothetical protein QOE45_3172 [Frankiaceae bacterium]|jgi:photosystem II stability/assembly factor-like uncharacterized protein|nr:hypothetical protein [Frankiaceae bacterium]
MRAPRVAGAVLLVAVALVAPGGAGAAGCANVVARGHGWTTIRSPFAVPEVVVPPPTNARSFENSGYSVVEGQYLTDHAVDPDTPSRLVATDGVTIVRSTDAGCTWTRVFSVGRPGGSGHDVAVDGRIMDFAVESTRLPAARQRMYATVQPVNGATSFDVATSADGGATWTRSPGPACADGLVAMAPSRPATVYLNCYGSSTETFWVSADAAKTWTKRESKVFGNPWMKGGFAVSPLDPDEIWTSGMGYGPEQYKQYWTILRTTDAGRSWQYMLQTQDHRDFYGIGLQLVPAARGRGLSVVAWNHDAILLFEAPKRWRNLVVPTPSGQAGAIELVTFGERASRLVVVAGYGVAGGHDIYPYGPTCTEHQRMLSYDLRARRWRFLTTPEVAHDASAMFSLRAAGPAYYARESGYRQGDCHTTSGQWTTGMRESYVVKYTGPT